jgi:Cell division protein FtsI/penicillin-binding protein 2
MNKERERRGKTIQLKKFNHKMQANLLLVFCLVIVAFIALIGRLLFIDYKDGNRYTKRVLSQQTYVSNAIPFKRGDIVDRNSTVLAKSVKVYNLVLDPKMILSETKYKNPTISALCSCFQITEDEINTILKEKPNMQYVVTLKELSYEQVSKFKKLQQKDKNQNIQGVWFEDEYIRTYPLKNIACKVVGFTTKGNVGNWGIEQYYNDELNGLNGREYGYFNSDLKLERTVKPAQNGNKIVTTIDANVQRIVQDTLTQFEKDMGSENAAVLVMNPKNGEIYAMASYPFYDLNDPTDLSKLYKKTEIDAMSEGDKLTAWNALWRNYCVSDSYEPGSTFKPVTVSAALDEGVITNKSSFVCKGSLKVADRTIHCSHTHGTINLSQAVEESCNVALMQISGSMGREKFSRDQEAFGFGQKTGIDLPGESSGLIYSKERLNPVEVATSSFGQGENVTMLQIASAFSSIINGGNYYQPHVVKQILNDSGATVSNIGATLIRKTITKQTSDLMKQYLYKTVEEGTGKEAKVAGYKIGGKTGTAENHTRDKKNYIKSFIGFAPVDDPQVVVYVLIDRPKTPSQSTSPVAIQLTGKIFKEILPFLGVYPTEDTTTDNNTGTNNAGTNSAGTNNAGTNNTGTNNAGTNNTGTNNNGTNSAGSNNTKTNNTGSENKKGSDNTGKNPVNN